MYEYILEGIILCFLCVFGIFANAVAMLYFGKQNLRKVTFYGFMFALSTIDLFFNVTCLCSFSISELTSQNCKGFTSDDCNVSKVFWQSLVWLVPLSNTFRTGSIYFTLALSIERYLVICRPLLYNSTSWITRWIMAGCILFPIIFNFTKFFEYEWGLGKQLINGTLHEEQTIIATKLLKNKAYVQIYLIWCDLIFHGLLPFTALMILNTFVLMEMKRYKKRCRGDSKEEQKRFTEVYIAKFNIVIVILFTACYSVHYVPVVYMCYVMIANDEGDIVNHFDEPDWFRLMISLSRVLEALNSSVAFAWFLFKHRLIYKLILKTRAFQILRNPHH